MNVIVVDTSSWISYFNGQQMAEVDLALQEGRAYLSPVVVAELLSGKVPAKQKRKLIDFLLELPLCNCDLAHWIRVGELRSYLMSKGLSASTPDSHVAQCCLDLDCYLISEDKIFKQISKYTKLKCLGSTD